jgi:2-polyprenyl-3-methyl-5-hydroxy-6-metoxy-1,4-benzoquinol methylase/uncharacterized protein YbaR (Trm112 family)
VEEWLLQNLVCPRDKLSLSAQQDGLYCSRGHRYPVFDGVPIMLLEEVEPTHGECTRSIEQARSVYSTPTASESSMPPGGVDPFVQQVIAATSGIMYRPLINNLTDYPIPDLPLPPSSGARLLDIGCNWGRWCISAARKDYRPVGIDPSLDAVLAARRVATRLDVSALYIVADARYLPFATDSFDVAFSYSVLQHLDKEHVKLCLAEVCRTLRPSGSSLIQMPNTFAARNFYSQSKRRFRKPASFDVRYWGPGELKQTFGSLIGPTTLSVDNYFCLGGQIADIDLLPPRYRAVVRCSDALRRLSERLPFMKYVADSLYVRSVKSGPEACGVRLADKIGGIPLKGTTA